MFLTLVLLLEFDVAAAFKRLALKLPGRKIAAANKSWL
jgi:hypothetical protein